MIPHRSSENSEDDVRYRVAACRRRLRRERATHLTEHQGHSDASIDNNRTPGGQVVESFAEIFATVSMNQSSISRLVECLLEPPERIKLVSEELEEPEEATTT
jgi:hypothetical protein